MGEFKGTKGKVIMQEESRNYLLGIEVDNKCVCEMSTRKELTDPEIEANAKLIVDAFNVRQKINFDLPELLEQRNELLMELGYAVKALKAVNSFGATTPIIERWESLIQKSTK